MLKRMRVEETGCLVAKLNPRRNFVMLAVSCVGTWIALAAPVAVAQADAAPSALASSDTNAAPVRALAFDVVSIKPIDKGGRPTNGWVGEQNRLDGVEFAFQNLRALIQYAYGSKRFPLADQITGVPDWAASQFYDINAKMSAEDVAEFQKLDKAAQEQWRETMMQAMLADRFQLKVHRGTKEAPIFEMVVAKGGIKMKDAATDPKPPLGLGADGKPHSGIRWLRDTSLVQNYSMESLAGFLSQPVSGIGRPVVDKTGLTGTYDFTFDWSVYSASAHAPQAQGDGSASDPAPSIFTAMVEIGLKLQPATGTLDTIAIDHAEKPTEN